MPDDLLKEISKRLLRVPGISAVFYDLTHKPPATIEWE
jgi:GMP synthase PP-ATPase subunit